MEIKMLTGLSGPDYAVAPGDVREFPDDEAARLIAAGFAVPSVKDRAERAVKRPAPETRAVT